VANDLLTADDLDELSYRSFREDDPLSFAGAMVAAVDEDRIADPADVSYALGLASEITERHGDLSAAETLAARAAAAEREHEPGNGFQAAAHARLLWKLGREDEAMRALERLRPLLVETNAAFYVADALEECGKADVAEQWLTDALVFMRRRDDDRDAESERRAAAVVYGLAVMRRRVRTNLGLPPDEFDKLADRLHDATARTFEDEGGFVDEPEVVLFWPEEEHATLLARWPELADEVGKTFEEHRTAVERALVQLSESGLPRIGLVTGVAGDLADDEVPDAVDLESYAEERAESSPVLPWPPGRNHPCWCGSRAKYKKCCLPRSRA
jgi:tetratricopeptide (TPR) repeat protein